MQQEEMNFIDFMNRFKTVEVRKAMGDRDARYCLDGIVDMDDAFFGAPDEGGKRGRGTEKTPAIAALSLDEEGRPGYLKIQAVENIDGVRAVEVAHGSITPGAVIQTDGLNVYGILNSEGYEQHGKKYDPQSNPEHLHWLRAVISNLKAFISGTYHGLGKKHLRRYFD